MLHKPKAYPTRGTYAECENTGPRRYKSQSAQNLIPGLTTHPAVLKWWYATYETKKGSSKRSPGRIVGWVDVGVRRRGKTLRGDGYVP